MINAKPQGFTQVFLLLDFVPLLNSSGVVWTENTYYVFGAKPPFRNSSHVVWREPNTENGLRVDRGTESLRGLLNNLIPDSWMQTPEPTERRDLTM